jgi:SAM-dependent methyltransferase
MEQPRELDTVERFSDRATDYVRYRPSYPAEAIQAVLDGLGPPSDLTAADIGAGTGISARLLGDRGVRVVAVEPGYAMRQAAAPHPHVVWVEGRAEATGLAPASVDLVLCAQSFHWFRAADALMEFARLLATRRRLAIVWNRRSRTDPLTVGYRHAVVEVGGDTGVESMSFDPAVIERGGLFSAPERRTFPNVQRLDLDGLIGRARSASYVPKTGAAGDRLPALMRALHETHADRNGFVTLVYETELFLSSKR